MAVDRPIDREVSTIVERAAGSIDIPAARTPQELAGIVQVFASSIQG
jgi:hypothetical protein